MTVLVVVKVLESLVVSLHVLWVEGEPGFDRLPGGGAPEDAGRAAQETGDTRSSSRRTTWRQSGALSSHWSRSIHMLGSDWKNSTMLAPRSMP